MRYTGKQIVKLINEAKERRPTVHEIDHFHRTVVVGNPDAQAIWNSYMEKVKPGPGAFLAQIKAMNAIRNAGHGPGQTNTTK